MVIVLSINCREGFRADVLRNDRMEAIHYTELIIACEACGSVHKYRVANQDDADKIFQEFECENGCGRNLYSFITLGTIEIKPPKPKTKRRKKKPTGKSSPKSKKP